MKEKEIRFSDIFDTIKKNRRILQLSILIGLIIGGIQFFGSPKEYIASSKLLPVIEQSNKLSGLGSLAGLAGIQLSEGGGSTIMPNLYPDVINSTPFGMYLIKQEFYFEEIDKEVLLEDYFAYYQEFTFFEKIKRFPKWVLGGFKSRSGPKEENKEIDREISKDLQKLTPKENSAISQIRNRITAEVDLALGVVSVQTKMQDPVVASKLAELTYRYLSEYITNYKASADQRNLEFIQERLEDAKLQYEKSQLTLANFKDRNYNLTLSSSQIRAEQLQNEVSLYFNVYNGLAQEVEQAKIRVQRAAPVFNVLEPPLVPLKESSPNLILNLVVFGFLGAVVALAYILLVKKD